MINLKWSKLNKELTKESCNRKVTNHFMQGRNSKLSRHTGMCIYTPQYTVEPVFKDRATGHKNVSLKTDGFW